MMIVARIATGVLFATSLAGCQLLEPGKPPSLSVAPIQGVRHGMANPDAQYAIGRYLQGQMRHEEAIAIYRRLLETHPRHTDAHNALGLMLAVQGQYDLAIAEFATASADAPEVASIRNNLGYAYLLQGNTAQAISVLEAARTLDPTNQRVRDNLDMALARGATEAEQNSVLAAAADGVSNPKPDMNAAATPPSAPTAPPNNAPPAGAPPIRLEISNANGVTRLARDAARELATAGYAQPRLTNAPPFQLAMTEIQYRPGFEAQALRLRETLRTPAPVAEASGLRWDVHLRLALGRNVSSTRELMAIAE